MEEFLNESQPDFDQIWATAYRFYMWHEHFRRAVENQKPKVAVKKCWSEKLLLEATEKSTRKYCTISCLQIGKTHQVLGSLESTRLEVQRGVIKYRIVTGTYIVQTLRSKFNQYQIDATCPLFQVEDEDITHMLLLCYALHSVRNEPFNIYM